MATRAEHEKLVRDKALREGPVTYALVRMLQRMDHYVGDADMLELIEEGNKALADSLNITSRDRLQAAVGKKHP